VNPNASNLRENRKGSQVDGESSLGERENLVRRLLVICVATVAVLVAFAVARKHPAVAHAASNPGNLTPGGFPAYPGCALGPTSTFCDQAPGTASTQGTFGVLNSVAVTNVAVSLAPIPGLASNFAAGDFTITNTTCTGSLAVNQGCDITVAFTPTSTGLHQAALTVTDSQGDTLAINIGGTGKNLMLAPPVQLGCPWDNAFTYCPQAVGSASSAETFTVTTGSGGATGINVSLAATPGLESEFAAGDFTIEGTTCTGSLAAFANCTVSVSFTPTTAGLRSATLNATDSSGDSTAIYLAGQTTGGMQFTTVVREATPSCALLIGRQFCNEPSGGGSAGRGFTLQNSSGTQINGLTIPKGSTTPNSSTPPDFTVQNTTCSSTLAANASCQITVQFTPQNTGLRQGAIAVTDAQGDVAAVNLAGTGDDYDLQLASGQTQELSVVAGGSVTFKAEAAPDNVFGMNGEQVTFVCPTNLPVNTSCTITPCPATVTAGTTTSFQIALVTSSATTVAPVPPQSTGCASYGFAGIFPPGLRGPEVPSAPVPVWWARRLRFPAGLFGVRAPAVFLLALAFALGALTWAGAGRRRRVRLALVATGLAVVVLPSCHHKSAKVTSATPVGVTAMTIQGNALDANGNPLSASRSMQIILDVTAK
jgi:hypothetical protein